MTFRHFISLLFTRLAGRPDACISAGQGECTATRPSGAAARPAATRYAAARFAGAVAVCAAVSACGTTKVLQEGESRLNSNVIVVEGGKGTDLKSSDISQYVLQQGRKSSPMMHVYNWGDGSGKGLDRLFKKIGAAPVVFNEGLVTGSVENIERHLAYLGYYDAKVAPTVETRRGVTDVTWNIAPGSRHTIDEVRYEIPGGEFAECFCADTAGSLVHPGVPLSENLLEQESARSAAVLREQGFYNLSSGNYFFVADTLRPGFTSLVYNVREYTRSESEAGAQPLLKCSFGEVSITRSKSSNFRDNVLRKINLIKPGDIYSETIVNNTYSRFSALKLFNGITVNLTPRDSATVDCNIVLSDSRPQSVKVDLEASVNSSGLLGISPKVSWSHKNIFHGGEWLTLGFNGNFQRSFKTDARSTEFGASASLTFPQFFGLPYSLFKGPVLPRTEFNASFNYQDRPEFRRSVATFNYGYSWQTSNGWYFQGYPLRVSRSELFDISEEFQQTYLYNPSLWESYESKLDAGVGFQVYHTTNPDIVPKTSYHYERFSIDLSGNVLSLFNRWLPSDYEENLQEYGEVIADMFTQYQILGVPYAQYVRAELNLGRTLRFGAEDGLALAMRMVAGAGYAYGNSRWDSLPYEKQFYCGGASSMRGWQSRTLGPGYSGYSTYSDIFSIPSQTGDAKLELDAELRFPLFWKLEGGLFAEAGNVWYFEDSEIESFGGFVESLGVDWGLGLRVNLDFILLRLDLGMKLHDPALEEGSRWLGPKGWFGGDGCAFHLGVGYPF